jgi:glycosyltransferase involved in cell wall biosynthesis
MKIVFISLMSGAQWGGSEELWYKTALYAKKQGDEVFASVFDWGTEHPKIKKLRNEGVKIFCRPRYSPEQSLLKKTGNFIKNRIAFLNRNYKEIIASKPDIIVLSQGNNFDISIHFFDLYQLLKKNNLNYILICHSHEQYSSIPQTNIYPRAKDIFVNARKVLFVSRKMAEMTQKQLITNLNNYAITWNPLNLSKYDYITYPKSETVNFAIVGGLVSGKGQDLALEIFSRSNWKSRNIHLNIYGNGYGSEYLIDLAESYNITQKVTFHGHFENITEVWNRNHILLIPSVGEGLPISLCEAMICGRTAVAADIGGITEVIYDNQTGFIAEAPSLNSFSAALEKAWNNRDKWEKMGIKAHEFAIENIDLNPEKTLYDIIAK